MNDDDIKNGKPASDVGREVVMNPSLDTSNVFSKCSLQGAKSSQMSPKNYLCTETSYILMNFIDYPSTLSEWTSNHCTLFVATNPANNQSRSYQARACFPRSKTGCQRIPKLFPESRSIAL